MKLHYRFFSYLTSVFFPCNFYCIEFSIFFWPNFVNSSKATCSNFFFDCESLQKLKKILQNHLFWELVGDEKQILGVKKMQKNLCMDRHEDWNSNLDLINVTLLFFKVVILTTEELPCPWFLGFDSYCLKIIPFQRGRFFCHNFQLY